MHILESQELPSCSHQASRFGGVAIGKTLRKAGSITYRLASQDEGKTVHRLVQLNSGSAWDWMDWSDIGANWILAEVDGIPKGCMMVSPGKPLGRADMLSVDPSLSKRLRAILARDLAYLAWDICRACGSQAVMMMIEWSAENQWLKIAMRRGAIPYAEGIFLVKPLGRASSC